jgi:hypothetical protein
LVCQHIAVPRSTSEQWLAYSLDEAKEQFKQRYKEMKAQGVRPFA